MVSVFYDFTLANVRLFYSDQRQITLLVKGRGPAKKGYMATRIALQTSQQDLMISTLYLLHECLVIRRKSEK